MRGGEADRMNGTSDGARSAVPDLLVERLLAGELDDKTAAGVRERLQSERRATGGADRLAELAASNTTIIEQYPVDELARRIRGRADAAARIDEAAHRLDRAAGRPIATWAWAVPGLATAIAMLLVVRSGPDGDRARADDASLIDGGDTERSKGLQPHLQVFRKRGEAAERLKKGAAVTAGDMLQVRYVATSANKHGAIVSLDGRGQVTLHFPARRDASTEMSVGKAIALPHAYEVDDAPAFERFVFCTSNRPIDVALILAAAADITKSDADPRTAELALPDAVAQSSFVVTKVTP